VKLTANTDLKKFSYKPLAMHLSEASEVLDDRIDEFASLVQTHHKIEDSSFGSAASKSTNEIIAVGRIASETPGAKLNAESVVLETSRRTGAGLRIPLRFEPGISYELFPGQIIAARGINASGDYFSVSEILEVPKLPPALSEATMLDAGNARLGLEDPSNATASHALNIMVSAGPFTADDNLDFEPLQALCTKAADTAADVLILTGPFLDIDHPLVASGDFDLPPEANVSPDKATLTDVFRYLIGRPLQELAKQVPSITIVLTPSARDAVNKHAAWPQEPFAKTELGLPRKQAKTVSNPVTISLNEMVVGISAQDILYDLRAQELILNKPTEANMMARLPRHVINQRHFFPLFPPTERSKLPKTSGGEEPTGTPLDVSYLKLGEWLNVTPDVLVTPSALPPFAKARNSTQAPNILASNCDLQVVDGVLAINPGTLSKRRGAGTYAQFTLHPRVLGKEERATGGLLLHKIYERARVDIVRI
jgi:DNA polymerase alpha subunit B